MSIKRKRNIVFYLYTTRNCQISSVVLALMPIVSIAWENALLLMDFCESTLQNGLQTLDTQAACILRKSYWIQSLNVEIATKLQLKFTAFISASRMMPSVTDTTTTNLTRVLVMYPYLMIRFTNSVDHRSVDAYTAKSSMAYSNPRYRSRFFGPFDTIGSDVSILQRDAMNTTQLYLALQSHLSMYVQCNGILNQDGKC